MTDTMYDAVNGSQYSNLTAGVGVSDTTIAVDTTEYLPDAPNIVNIYHVFDGEITKWERCRYTVKTATTLTIERSGDEHSSSGTAEEGLAFIVGDRIARLFTGWDHKAFKSNIEVNAAGIATNVADISTNAGLIADNTSDISALDARVSTNEGDISTNAADISTNASGIAANVGDISALDGRVTANEGDISTNVSNIATNAADISDMPTTVQTLENKTINSNSNTLIIDGGTL